MQSSEILNLLGLDDLINVSPFGLYPISVYIPFGFFIFMTISTLLFTLAIRNYSYILALELSKLLSILTCFYSAFLLVLPLFFLIKFRFESFTTLGGLFKLSPGVFLLQIIIISIGIIALYITNNSFFLNKQYYLEPNFLVSSIIFGSLCVFASNDLLSVFLTIELQTIPLVLLISFMPYNMKAVDAGIKYFVVSAISSSVLLFGLALWYFIFGITNFDFIGNLFFMINYHNLSIPSELPKTYKLLAILAVIFIIISLIIKLTAAPFHYWVLDIYNYSAISSLLIFSVIPKLPLAIVLCNIFINIFNYDLFYSLAFNIILIIGLISVVVGTVGAFSQAKLTNILGFGSISHVGFILISMLCTKNLTIFITFVYLISYSINTLLFFNVWVNVMFDNKAVNYINFLSGLAYRDIKTCLTLTISLFSFSGLPPTLGFAAKLLVFIGLINNGAIFTACILFLLSLLSNVYYLRIVKIMWFENASDILMVKALNTNLSVINWLLNLVLISLIIFGNLFAYLIMYF